MQPVNFTVALDTAQRLHQIGAAARNAFIERDEAIEVLEVALACGEHVFLAGAPGTAKSALVRFFADAMGLRFYRRVLNPDTTREDLVGPISPTALREGRWERVWAGLATADFALLDEIGKASNQVQNMLLDVMEERRVTSGDIDQAIPLHLAVAGTNETLGPDQEAVFDRFTLRCVVHSIHTANSLSRLLTDSWCAAPLIPVGRSDLAECRAAVLVMASNPPPEVVDKLVQLWSKHAEQSDSRISDRRWKRVLLVAAGRALLYGRKQIGVEDLVVTKHMLWGTVEEIETIQQWIETIVNEELAALQQARSLLQELLAKRTDNLQLEAAGLLAYRAGQLLKEIRPRVGLAWDGLRTEIEAFREAL